MSDFRMLSLRLSIFEIIIQMKIRGGIPLDVQLESYTRSRSLRKVVVATVLAHTAAHTMTVHASESQRPKMKIRKKEKRRRKGEGTEKEIRLGWAGLS